jgi:hypothetical protein
LAGAAPASGTNAVGISTTNHENIVIRNGKIRGFLAALDVGGTGSKAVIVEDLRLDENTAFGIRGASPIANLHILDNSIVGVTQNSGATGAPDGIHVLGVRTARSVMIVGIESRASSTVPSTPASPPAGTTRSTHRRERSSAPW